MAPLRIPAVASALFCFLGAGVAAAQTVPTVTGAALGVSSITWTWTASAGATGYRILSSTGGGNISGDLPATRTAFTLLGLSTNTAATVTVEAFNGGATADSAPSTVFTAAAVPSATTVLGTFGSQVSIGWNGNGNPTGTQYQIAWSTSPNSPVYFSTTPVAGSSVSATITDLPASQTVSFMVRAFNAAGVPTGFDVAVSTTLPTLFGQPVISSATFALGVSSITWYWSASTGALNYQVFGASNGAVSPLLPASQLSFTQTGLQINTAYQNYVTAYSAAASTNSAPFTRYTRANPTVGLTLLGLSSATTSGVAELLSWGANGNPASTQYTMLWWTNVTSTVPVAVSTPATTAQVTGLYGGSTIYFTVQAQNGDGIPTAFDSTFYAPTFAVSQSTFFPVGAQILPPGGAGLLTFALPNGFLTLTISSDTFPVQVTITVSTPGVTTVVPSLGAGLSDLPTPVRLQIAATDAFGGIQQPRLPVLMTFTYAPFVLGGVDPLTLGLVRFDPIHDAWVTLLTSKSGRMLMATTNSFSVFAVAGQAPASDASQITVGPNPLRPVVNPGQIMTFRHLPPNARLRFFTYAGEKIIDLNADGSGVAGWDGRNRNGSAVASGVYIVVIEGLGAKKTMRVAVER